MGADTNEHRTLVLAGFDSRSLSYQSSAQRFSSRRERLQHDLAMLVAYGLVSAEPQARRVAYGLSDSGSIRAGELRFATARELACFLWEAATGLCRRARDHQAGKWRR